MSRRYTVTVEQFSEGDSLLHRIDPRVKICLAFPYAFVIALSESVMVALVALAVGCVLVILARLDVRAILKNLRMLLVFILLLWILLPLTVRGTML